MGLFYLWDEISANLWLGGTTKRVPNSPGFWAENSRRERPGSIEPRSVQMAAGESIAIAAGGEGHRRFLWRGKGYDSPSARETRWRGVSKWIPKNEHGIFFETSRYAVKPLRMDENQSKTFGHGEFATRSERFPLKPPWIITHDGSMYGIYANIGGILMVNVTIYGIHTNPMDYTSIIPFMGTCLWPCLITKVWWPCILWWRPVNDNEKKMPCSDPFA